MAQYHWLCHEANQFRWTRSLSSICSSYCSLVNWALQNTSVWAEFDGVYDLTKSTDKQKPQLIDRWGHRSLQSRVNNSRTYLLVFWRSSTDFFQRRDIILSELFEVYSPPRRVRCRPAICRTGTLVIALMVSIRTRSRALPHKNWLV
jgi:hypothetical protein